MTGCKSVRMTSQDRQQFMPNGISVAQQLLEETEDATQAKSPEAIKTTLSANNTTSESSVEESESSMKESNHTYALFCPHPSNNTCHIDFDFAQLHLTIFQI